MRKLLLRAVFAIIVTASGIPIAAAADPDPVVGTWQLNVSKSTFTPGPAPKSETRTYSQSGQSMTLIVKTVSALGKEATLHTTFQLNGKDFPVTGSPDYDSASGKQVDSNTAEITFKKGGKVVGTLTRTVSKDGKTLTSTSKVTSATGERSENVSVFDKQ